MRKPIAEITSDHSMRLIEEDGRTTLVIYRPDGSVLKEVVFMAPPKLEGSDADEDDY
jgi:hypothetical protein